MPVQVFSVVPEITEQWEDNDAAVLTATSRAQLTAAIAIMSAISSRGWIYPQDKTELVRTFSSLQADHIEEAA